MTILSVYIYIYLYRYINKRLHRGSIPNMTWQSSKMRWTIWFLRTSMQLWDNSIVFEDLPVSVRVYRRGTSRTRKGILVNIKSQLIPVNFQIHYYSYTISENGLNKIYFRLITYNVFACANSDMHLSFTLCHHSWTKIQY